MPALFSTLETSRRRWLEPLSPTKDVHKLALESSQMRSMYLRIAAFLLLLVTAPALAEVPERIPDPTGDDKPAIWLCPGEAMDARGEVRADQFEPLAKANLERHLAREREARARAATAEKAAVDACHSYSLVPSHPVAPELTVETLLDQAELAFIGTVEDRAQGFYHGHPNSLVEIRIEKVLKAPPNFQGIDRLYSTFPHVEMKVGSEMLCIRSQRYPQEPVLGKQIMIFTDNIPDREPLIVAPVSETIFLESPEGHAWVPERFKDEIKSASWDELVDRAVEEAKTSSPLQWRQR